MQTKSYRLLKWTLLACVSASLASACVVTTGDGGGDDFFDEGGEGGGNTAGTKTTTGGAGTSSTAGSGGKATGGGGAATTAGTGGTSNGGTASYVPGLCDAASSELEGPTPSMPADTTLTEDDEKPANACRKCMKAFCKDEWSTCYGTAPTIACGFGATDPDDGNDVDSDLGQFDCILGCFFDGAEDPMGTAEELISECSAKCTNQCDDADSGNVMVHTSELIECANDPEVGCQAECFAF
jgi:hypothetical protein